MTTAVRLALGLLSMAGFTASGGAAVAGVIGKTTTLVLMVISIGVYLGVLVKAEDARRYRLTDKRMARRATDEAPRDFFKDGNRLLLPKRSNGCFRLERRSLFGARLHLRSGRGS